MNMPLLAAPSASTSAHGGSLVAVLSYLGHRCAGICGPAGDELDARVWFTRRRSIAQGRAHPALVVIDTRTHQGTVLGSIQLLRHINACTNPDGIKVTRRRSGDAGLALATALPSRRNLT